MTPPTGTNYSVGKRLPLTPGSKETILSIEQFGQNLKFEKPATYRIRVTGHIDDSLADQLRGMVISRAFTGGQPTHDHPGRAPERSGGPGRCAERTLRAAPAVTDSRVPKAVNDGIRQVISIESIIMLIDR